MFKIEIPESISTNRLHKGTKGRGGKNLTEEYTKWKDQAGWTINALPIATRRALPACFYVLEIRFHWASRIDIDNGLKSLHDLLVKMRLTPDDSLLWGEVYYRCMNTPKKRTVIQGWSCVEELGDSVKHIKMPPKKLLQKQLSLSASPNVAALGKHLIQGKNNA